MAFGGALGGFLPGVLGGVRFGGAYAVFTDVQYAPRDKKIQEYEKRSLVSPLVDDKLLFARLSNEVFR